MESNVTAALDTSLLLVLMEPKGSYLGVSRFSDIHWQIPCGADFTNFSCSVAVKKLKLFNSLAV